jgi:flagellar biogenesis protein FliO
MVIIIGLGAIILLVLFAIWVVVGKMETEEHYQDEQYLNEGK